MGVGRRESVPGIRRVGGGRKLPERNAAMAPAPEEWVVTKPEGSNPSPSSVEGQKRQGDPAQASRRRNISAKCKNGRIVFRRS